MPQVLADRPTWGLLSALADKFPQDVLCALEFRLAQDAPAVDFSIRLDRPSHARALRDVPASPHLRKLLDEWADGRWDEIEAVWLEFDLGAEHPLFCVRLKDVPLARDPEAIVERFFPALIDASPSEQQRESLLRAVRLLPPGARVLYAFSLAPRPGNGFRLEVWDFGPPALSDYVSEAISAEAGARIAALEPLVCGADRYHLSFDVFDDGFSPRIGVELGFQRIPEREPRWREAFDRLVDADLCTAEKRDAVFEWTGWETARDAGDRWPASVRRGYCIRALSHLKLVSSPQSLEAKAYLLLQYLERRPTA